MRAVRIRPRRLHDVPRHDPADAAPRAAETRPGPGQADSPAASSVVSAAAAYAVRQQSEEEQDSRISSRVRQEEESRKEPTADR